MKKTVSVKIRISCIFFIFFGFNAFSLESFTENELERFLTMPTDLIPATAFVQMESFKYRMVDTTTQDGFIIFHFNRETRLNSDPTISFFFKDNKLYYVHFLFSYFLQEPVVQVFNTLIDKGMTLTGTSKEDDMLLLRFVSPSNEKTDFLIAEKRASIARVIIKYD